MGYRVADELKIVKGKDKNMLLKSVCSGKELPPLCISHSLGNIGSLVSNSCPLMEQLTYLSRQ